MRALLGVDTAITLYGIRERMTAAMHELEDSRSECVFDARNKGKVFPHPPGRLPSSSTLNSIWWTENLLLSLGDKQSPRTWQMTLAVCTEEV